MSFAGLFNTDPLGGDPGTNLYRTVMNGAPWKSDIGGSSASPGMPAGPLTSGVNPTAAGLVEQSMNGLPVLPQPGEGDALKKQLWQMMMMGAMSGGKPLISVQTGKGKGVDVGGGAGGMGGMNPMMLMMLQQMLNGKQVSSTAMSGNGPTRPVR
jgi:hypothetical protein